MKKYFAAATLAFTLVLSQISFSQADQGSASNSLSSITNGKELDARPPVKVINFGGNVSSGKVTLQWTIDENETTDRFELEKSIDGVNFALAALVFTSEKTGNENYMFYERFKRTTGAYYRLKIYSKNQDINYSKILRIPN